MSDALPRAGAAGWAAGGWVFSAGSAEDSGSVASPAAAPTFDNWGVEASRSVESSVFGSLFGSARLFAAVSMRGPAPGERKLGDSDVGVEFTWLVPGEVASGLGDCVSAPP